MPSPKDPAHISEVTAARKGREAAMAGESIHSCPYHALYLSAAWRNGWAEARALRRREEDSAYRLATDPPGKLRATQVGQRMSRETMIERFGDRFI